MARYTHRVAISNARLVDVSDSGVTFTYKDYAAGVARKTMTLSGVEFLRRFFTRLLPKGFVHIRSYGLLANRWLSAERSFRSSVSRKRTSSPRVVRLPRRSTPKGRKRRRCRCCGGRLRGLDYRPRPSRQMLGLFKWPWDTS
jgi:hypothetical protein